MADSIRVLVVDDSAFMRRVLKNLLESDPQVRVVALARDGVDAVAKVAEFRPDVVTLDVEMPRMDGLQALRRIMAQTPVPVVMVSSLTQTGAKATIEALALGAVDVVPKPSGAVSMNMPTAKADLLAKVKNAATILPGRLRQAVLPPSTKPDERQQPIPGRRRLSNVVIVAASTGGPGALHRLLTPLPAGLRAGLCLVQHMPAGFTKSLAQNLDAASALHIREAEAGDLLVDGQGLLAPGGQHLSFKPGGVIHLHQAPPRHGVRPAADVTLESFPTVLAQRTIVVIMSGMGVDGAAGAARLKAKGAKVWVQNEPSSVVYGMARAVVEKGLADRAGTPEQLAAWLSDSLGVEEGLR